MCIKKCINSISKYVNNKYYNTYDFNLINTFKKSFSTLATLYNNTNKTQYKQEEYLEHPKTKPENPHISKKIYKQIIYHNLTYDHGITILF